MSDKLLYEHLSIIDSLHVDISIDRDQLKETLHEWIKGDFIITNIKQNSLYSRKIRNLSKFLRIYFDGIKYDIHSSETIRIKFNANYLRKRLILDQIRHDKKTLRELRVSNI